MDWTGRELRNGCVDNHHTISVFLTKHSFKQVSDASSVKRTAVDCRTVWIGDQHPRFNHAEWTSEEVSKLNTLLSTYVQKKETVNWVSVAEQLGVCSLYSNSKSPESDNCTLG